MHYIVLISIVLSVGVCSVSSLRIYPYLDDAAENPQYPRHYTHPPPDSILTNHTLFATFRGFGLNSSFYIVDYEEDLDLYFTQMQLGDVLWPEFHFLLGVNLGDVLEAIAARNLIVVDIWDYVPGDTDNCYADNSICEYHLPSNVSALLFQKLGSYYTGMDVGEQDGRYIGGYANQYSLQNASGEDQYLYFSRHFQRMTNDLGSTVSALTSLYMPHYLLKTGLYSTVGSETAQALPNAQLFLSFDRGSCKQYASKWWGNVSIYNRWGYKSYPGTETNGTSLSLMKRLMYSQIMYNSAYVSFESSWLYSNNNTLSPVGNIQQSARRWVAANQNDVGAFLANVGVMLDFEAGFVPPRQLYNGNLYQNWGSVPYGPGDHLTNAFFDFMYNGYADSSYFHDEKGFQSPTPFGDTADVLLSDAPSFVIDRYPVLVIAGELSPTGKMSIELNVKLTQYVTSGGFLIITAESLANIGPLFGISVDASRSTQYGAGETIDIGGNTITEEYSFTLLSVSVSSSQGDVTVLASVQGVPVAYLIEIGSGSMLLFATPFAISSVVTCATPIDSLIDVPLPIPFPLLSHVTDILNSAFLSTIQLFTVGGPGNQLTYSTNFRASGEYTVSIFNPILAQQDFEIQSLIGSVESIVEISIPDDETNDIGYLPAGFENSDLGGAVRIFMVTLSSDNSVVIPHVTPAPLAKRRGLFLKYGETQTEVLKRPSFFDHYDTVVVDWKILTQLDAEYSSSLGAWASLQSLNIFLDLSSGINLYPDFRIIKNAMDDFNNSMIAIQNGMSDLRDVGGQGVILALHRQPENFYTEAQTLADFQTSLVVLNNYAHGLGLTVYLRMLPRQFSDIVTLTALIDTVSAASSQPVFLAASTGMLLSLGMTSIEVYAKYITAWYVGCFVTDPLTGAVLNTASSLASCPTAQLTAIQSLVAQTPGAMLIPEAYTADQNAEYLEISALEALFPSQ